MINTAGTYLSYCRQVNENKGKPRRTRWADARDELNTSRETRREFDREEVLSNFFPRTENHGRKLGKEQFF